MTWEGKARLFSVPVWTEGTQRHVGTYNVRLEWTLGPHIELSLFAVREYDSVKLEWGYEELIDQVWKETITDSWPWDQLNNNAALGVHDPLVLTLLLDTARTETTRLGEAVEQYLTDLDFDSEASEAELRAWANELVEVEAQYVDR